MTQNSNKFMKGWVVFSQLSLIALAAVVFRLGSYGTTFGLSSLSFHTALIAGGVVGLAFFIMVATCFAERLVIFRLVTCLYGLLVIVAIASAALLGGAGVGAYKVMRDMELYTLSPNSIEYDVNVAVEATWSACCSGQYKVHLEFEGDKDMHPKRLGASFHDSWLNIKYNDTSNKIEVNADVTELCGGLKDTFKKNSLTFDCVRYPAFRTTLFNFFNPMVLAVAITGILSAVMSFFTMIFAFCLACHCRKQPTPATLESTPGRSPVGGKGNEPLMQGQAISYV